MFGICRIITLCTQTYIRQTDNLIISILIKVKVIEKMTWTTSVSKRIAAAAKKNELKIRKATIETYCKSIHERKPSEQTSNKGRVNGGRPSGKKVGQ